MKYLNRKEADEKTDGILEGIGWEYDYGGNRDANKIKSHISSLRTRDLDALIEHWEKTLKEVRPLFTFNDFVIDSSRAREGTILGQQKVLTDLISFLTSLKEQNK